MPCRKYKSMRFSEKKMDIVNKANTIVKEYTERGYSLTLRALYYQFVARDLFPADWQDEKTGSTNNLRSYQKLSIIVADARLSGLMDWESVNDATRELTSVSHWSEPGDIIKSAARSFRLDKWANQANRVEIWIEKDAIENVVSKAASALDTAYFSCRGYTSLTAIWNAGQRLKEYARRGQTPVILHLGDFDPSGLDMSRDIEEKVSLFMDGLGSKLHFQRIALNQDQIEQYKPPANPAKTTDVRFVKFQEKYGDDSWELDALDPGVIEQVIRDKVSDYLDADAYDALADEETEHRETLTKAASNWTEYVAPFVKEL